ARRALPGARDLLTSGSGLMLLVSLLLPWYYYSGSSFWDSGADTGAHELPTVALVFLVVTGVAALFVPLVSSVGPLRPRGPLLRTALIVLGAVSLLVAVYFGLVHYPHSESTNQFGVALALIGATGVTVGAYLSTRASR